MSGHASTAFALRYNCDAETNRLRHHRATMDATIKYYTFLQVLRCRAVRLYGIDLFANLYVTTHRKESYDDHRGKETELRYDHPVMPSFNSRWPIVAVLFFVLLRTRRLSALYHYVPRNRIPVHSIWNATKSHNLLFELNRTTYVFLLHVNFNIVVLLECKFYIHFQMFLNFNTIFRIHNVIQPTHWHE